MINRLKKIFREDQILFEKKDLNIFNRDFSKLKGNAAYIVRPETIEQIRELVLIAKRYNFDLVIRGSGSSFNGSSLPLDSIIVDMSFFNKIKKVNTLEQWIEAECFATLDEINSILKAVGLFFPFFTYSSSISTIGGLIALDSKPLYFYQFNSLKDFVLGMEYVDGNGRVFYIDEHNSFEKLIGSEGSFAIITKVRLKAVPIIPQTSVVFSEFLSIKELLRKANELETKLKDRILSIEFISKSAQTEPNRKYKLFVEYDNSDQFDVVSENIFSKAKKIIKKIFSYEIEEKKNSSNLRPEEKKNLFKSLFVKFSAKGQIFDCFVPIDKYYDFIKFCELNNIPLFGKLDCGIFYFLINDFNDNIIDKINNLIMDMGGSLKGTCGFGLLKMNYLSESEKEKFAENKFIFDPDNIFNRGKVISEKYFRDFRKNKLNNFKKILSQKVN